MVQIVRYLVTRHVASVSFGKDSLAMVHILMEKEYPLDEVIYYNTGAEFDCIYEERDKMLPIFEKRGIKFTELRPNEPFFYQMFAHPVKSRKTHEIHKHGYGWCGGPCRWGTTYKNQTCAKHANGAIQYVGIASDETHRKLEEGKRYPLIDWGMSEADCLEYCYSKGHVWDEGGVRLYDVLDRVSCWCCRNKNEKELRAMHEHLPKYWNRLIALESVLGQMKSKPLSAIAEVNQMKLDVYGVEVGE